MNVRRVDIHWSGPASLESLLGQRLAVGSLSVYLIFPLKPAAFKRVLDWRWWKAFDVDPALFPCRREFLVAAACPMHAYGQAKPIQERHRFARPKQLGPDSCFLFVITKPSLENCTFHEEQFLKFWRGNSEAFQTLL